MPDHGIRGKKATEFEEFNYTQPTNYSYLKSSAHQVFTEQ